MQEIVPKLLALGHSMWRFRWGAIACAWGVALAGWAAVLLMPNQYEARAKVYVDTDSVLRPLLKGLAAETDVMGEVSIMTRALTSRPQLEKAARETDLYLRARNPKEAELLMDDLREKINITGDPYNQNLYSISFTDHERGMSIRVVQKLLDTFVEDTLGVKREDSTSAQRFLEEQIREYEKRLRDAEDRLAEFKRANVGQMPDKEGDYYTRLQTAMMRLDTLQGDYTVAKEKRDQLAKEIEGEEPTFGIVSSALEAQGPINSQIAESKKKLEALLLNFTEKHPDVIALREQIAKLEEQKLTERDSAGPIAGGGPALLNLAQLDVNPVYQRMKMALTEAEVDMAALRGKIADVNREVAGLRSRVDTIPEVEAQLAQLNRDYEVNKAQYTALVQRLESARLSGEVEQTRDEVKFRILEPPMAALRPVGPNRMLFSGIVLAAALGAGIALAFLLGQITPVFAERRELATLTGLPVLGSISRALAPVVEARERRGFRVFLTASAGLAAAFVTVLIAGSIVSSTLGAVTGGAP
jgi:polysaccharide chain length determinant protein (PEP-CTERM system associated)